jgi:hypothetical protein
LFIDLGPGLMERLAVTKDDVPASVGWSTERLAGARPWRLTPLYRPFVRGDVPPETHVLAPLAKGRSDVRQCAFQAWSALEEPQPATMQVLVVVKPQVRSQGSS